MPSLAIVIPTYRRAAVLLNTLAMLLDQTEVPDEILVVDQTNYDANDQHLLALQELNRAGMINFIQVDTPSIPGAMNLGLRTAVADFVLFLDDDIKVRRDFVANHLAALGTNQYFAFVGQVLQPEEIAEAYQHCSNPADGLTRDLDFKFYSSISQEIYNCMAGNLCVHRKVAIDAGGFDMNFSGAAFRFETEFCRRMIRYTNTPFLFVPTASIDHLQISSGGTRSESHHLSSASAIHSVGDYYFAMREASGVSLMRYCLRRLLSSIKAKFYLAKPWYIPVRLVAELRGLLLARKYAKQGARLLNAHSNECERVV